MDIGAILSGALSLYRRNLNLILPHLIASALGLLVLLVFGVIAAVVLVSVLGSITVGSITSLLYGPAPFLLIAFAIFALLALVLIFMFFSACARAAVIGMVVEARKDGKTSLNTGFKSTKKHGLAIFGYTLAIGFVPVFVIGGIIVAVVAVLAIISAGTGEGPDIGFAFIAFMIFLVLLFLIAYVVIYVLALFSPQKIVVEGRGVVDGIKASSGFVRAHPTGVVIYIGFAFAVAVITSLFSVLLAVPGIAFEYVDHFIAVFFRIIENIVSIFIGFLVAPYLEAVKTLMVLETGGEV